MIISVIRFLNIIVAALLAGISVGIWIGFNPLDLSPSTYIEQQQNTIRSLNVLMISLVVFATVITIISAFLQKGNKENLIVLLIASLFFISCILISRFGNQPINKIIMTWTTDSLPANLSELRDKWWSFHIMRTIAELIALFLVTWISIKKY
jgi:ABC-type proline/glycine betaine transport system permease subunit